VSEHSSLVGVLLNAPRRSAFAAISPWLVFEHPWIDVRHPLHLLLKLGATAAREGSALVPVPGESAAHAALVKKKLVRRRTDGQLEVRGTPPAARIRKRRDDMRRRQRKHRGLTGDGTARRTRRVHRPWETMRLPPRTIAGVRWSVDLFKRCWYAGFVALHRPFDLWLVSLLYCYVAQTDGFVPHVALAAYTSCGVEAAIRALVAIGAWIPVEGGYQVWGFTRFNWTKAQINRERARPWYQAHKRAAVRAREAACHMPSNVRTSDHSKICTNSGARAATDQRAARAVVYQNAVQTRRDPYGNVIGPATRAHRQRIRAALEAERRPLICPHMPPCLGRNECHVKQEIAIFHSATMPHVSQSFVCPHPAPQCQTRYDCNIRERRLRGQADRTPGREPAPPPFSSRDLEERATVEREYEEALADARAIYERNQAWQREYRQRGL
jgi:hypothetical protein